MKIAVISTIQGYRWAGSEELWYGTALQALDAGHQISVYLHRQLGAAEQIQHLASRGGTVHLRRPMRIARLWPIKERVAPTFPVRQLDQCDVILVSLGSLLDLFYVPGLLCSLRETKTRLVFLCQFNAESLAFQPGQRAALRELFSRSAGSCFVSRQNLTLAERQLAMELPQALVVGNPVRTNLPKPLSWPEGKTVRLGCVARLETLWKGQDLLLEILSREPWPSRDWTLSFFGEGPDLEHLQRAARFFRLEERVNFRGYVRHLEEIWADHHLMVLPSRGEGLPLAILEAMMCGRPTVTTDVGGNREIIDDGKTGFIAEAATPGSFGRALERAWNALSGWPEMGLAAHQRAQEIAGLNPAQQLLDYLSKKTHQIGN